ncbi:MAG TPA: MATE family efflux transporter, partial [Vicinamibacteria bacterium]|nr:MATE family efflux transporter [Vicinamibacteria bacterium]
VLSQLSYTVQMFVDRLFLTWYSPEALAGTVTASFLVWVVVGLFVFTGEYVTTFVAQYLGAERPRRVGPALWQGAWFSLAAGLFTALLAPLAGPVFARSGHAPGVVASEIAYSRVLLLGGFAPVLMATMASFFAGRGRTTVILLVNVVVTLINGALDWLWIFGNLGFPRAGEVGAGWATVTSQLVGAGIYIAIILRRENREAYGTSSGWRLEPDLFRRLLRYGLPAGLQFSMEILSFSLFMIVIGRIGTAPLAASGIAFNLNMIVFMPMLGCALATTSLVGRYLGAGRPELAERSTYSAFFTCLVYMVSCCAGYVLFPGPLLAPFGAEADPAAFAEVAQIAAVLLRFVAFYSLFDMMNVIFAAGLKGAGDTRFPVVATTLLSWALMVVPAWVLCARGGHGVYTAWTAASVYILVNGLLMLRRFRGGHWKGLRLIEAAAAPVPVAAGE